MTGAYWRTIQIGVFRLGYLNPFISSTSAGLFDEHYLEYKTLHEHNTTQHNAKALLEKSLT
jgi:hypothetical protein